MCTFNEKASYQIIAVKEFLSNDNNYHLIVVTDTNPMHHDFNLKQIGGQEFDNSRVHFINSFAPLVKGKSKFDRAISGILELQLKEILPKGQNISITSFHSAIDAHQLFSQLQPKEEFRGKHTAHVCHRSGVKEWHRLQ